MNPGQKKIVLNTVLDYLRKQKREQALINYHAFDAETPAFEASELATGDSKLEAKDILAAIKKLPEPGRTVLNLFVFEQYSYKEIAQTMEISESTCRWHLMNARKALKNYLYKMDELVLLIK